MSNDNNIIPDISTSEKPEMPASLKAWHRPVISRIEIAQTLNGTLPTGDSDNGQHVAS